MKVCTVCKRCYADSVEVCETEGHLELLEDLARDVKMIEGYVLESHLRSDIEGELYLARHDQNYQPCRIWLPRIEPTYSQAFLDDAARLKTLFDGHLVDVYQSGRTDAGVCYVVCEMATGKTVRQLLDDVGTPTLLTAVQIARQAAEAVFSLHQEGLPHGAVRPENLILTTDAEQRLEVRLDLPDLGGASRQTMLGNKFAIDDATDWMKYFAPEVFGDNVSERSDVYSLGIVLFELLSGKVPFEAEKATDLIAKHRDQRPPDVQIDSFDLRMLITHTLAESLQKDPGKRQASANVFARQLRHVEQLALHVPTPAPVAAKVARSEQPSFAPPASPEPTSSNVTPRKVRMEDIDDLPIINFGVDIDAPSPEGTENVLPVSAVPEVVAESVLFTKVDAIEIDDDVPTLQDVIRVRDLEDMTPSVEIDSEQQSLMTLERPVSVAETTMFAYGSVPSSRTYGRWFGAAALTVIVGIVFAGSLFFGDSVHSEVSTPEEVSESRSVEHDGQDPQSPPRKEVVKPAVAPDHPTNSETISGFKAASHDSKTSTNTETAPKNSVKTKSASTRLNRGDTTAATKSVDKKGATDVPTKPETATRPRVVFNAKP